MLLCSLWRHFLSVCLIFLCNCIIIFSQQVPPSLYSQNIWQYRGWRILVNILELYVPSRLMFSSRVSHAFETQGPFIQANNCRTSLPRHTQPSTEKRTSKHDCQPLETSHLSFLNDSFFTLSLFLICSSPKLPVESGRSWNPLRHSLCHQEKKDHSEQA